ncbi:MAG: IPT/TIG domain-containing protein [Pseudomonadota bacterium]|nr:IPT/TIG domain-containing protein [Pseudomonadota bacterium]
MQHLTTLISQWLLRLGLALCLLASPLLGLATPQTSGEWQNGPNFPFFPVHSHLLPNGTVLMWPGDGVSGDDPRIWDPVSGSVTAVERAGYDTFCSGHVFLPDGRLFVAGGHISNNIGLPEAAIFNPATKKWTRQPDMNLGRWYPTTTALPGGDVLVVAGNVDLSTGSNPLPQVWQSSTGTWRDLSAAQLWQPHYPYMFLAPNGSVFSAGPEVATRYLNTAGTGAWSHVANRTFQSMRDYGSAVMYAPGKILFAGGGDAPTATAEVIDLNTGSPAWRAIASMSAARRMMNATLLPDGKVFVSGGTKGAGFDNGDPGMPVLTPEMWDPTTEAWTPMASSAIPRLYHSIAMLMPDARVIISGGNGYTQTEIFSPPYLFAGPRPSISSAPASVGRGQSFFMGTPDAAGITGVTWVALPSVTHTNNMQQGFFRSASITQASGGINIVAPNDPTVLPGFYMVFLLKNGVPSTAKIIQLGTQSNNPQPSISSMTPTSATAGGPAFSLAVTGTNFVNGASVRWNGSNRPTTFVSATQLTAAIPASDIAAAGTAQVSVFNPAPGGGASLSLAFAINAPTQNNPAPVLSSIAPASAEAGGPAFTLTATGSGFVAASKVHWNGTARTTTFVSATQLSAQIAASDIAAAGTAQVTVVTPTPGGGTSVQKAFTITSGSGGGSNPVPVLASLAPSNAVAGGPGFTLSVNGSNFVSGASVRWNGAARPTTFVSATQLTAAIPASDIAAAGTAQVSVFNPAPGGGTSGAQPFTIAASQNLAAQGSIIARVTAPQGGGSRNIAIIRDGVMPPVGSADASAQYDTWDGANTASEDWIGYQFSSPQTFNRVVFQEGRHFADGGWFTTLTVQVRQGGNWVNVSGLTITPTYPGINNTTSYETYTLQFTPVSADAIRIHGNPGGSADFISVAELQVYGNGSTAPAPVPAISSLAPASAIAGGPGFSLSVSGSNFVTGTNASVVRWNGTARPTTFVSATQLTAAIPASDIAAAGTVQVSVFNPATGGGNTSGLQPFTIAAAQNLAAQGSIIARVTAPQGGGSRNIAIIRDGVMPPVGSADALAQYDTWDGANTASEDWIGYQFSSPQTFNRVVFQEGRHFADGGWFTTLTVQVRQGGNWVNVSGLTITPTYPGINNTTSYETYSMQFTPVSADAIRIHGNPGGSADFISVGELQVYGP